MPRRSGHAWTAVLLGASLFGSDVANAQSAEVSGKTEVTALVEEGESSPGVRKRFDGWDFEAEMVSSVDDDGLSAALVSGRFEGWRIVAQRVVRRSGPQGRVIDIDGAVRLRSVDSDVVLLGDHARIDVDAGAIYFDSRDGERPRLMLTGKGWALHAREIRISLKDGDVTLTDVGQSRPG